MVENDPFLWLITMTHKFRLYFSIEPVVRARRLAAENEIEMCDDREDCCSGNSFQKWRSCVRSFQRSRSRSSFQVLNLEIRLELSMHFINSYWSTFYSLAAKVNSPEKWSLRRLNCLRPLKVYSHFWKSPKFYDVDGTHWKYMKNWI